jgi:heat shock protein HslJ
VDVSELEGGGEWWVVSIGGQPVLGHSTPTIAFADGRVAGRATVNRYHGPYRIVDGGIVLGPVAMTLMAGPPEAMEQERRFVEALGGRLPIAIEGDTLAIGTVVARRRHGMEAVGGG